MGEIDEVIARVPQWQGCSIVVAPLNDGLTDTNFKVEVDGMPYVVRVPGEQTELLCIDRRNEYNNTLIAARAGLGARLLYYAPEQCVMALEYIPGPTMSAARMRAPGMIPRLASSIRLLHTGPTFRNRFNMFRVMEYYLQVVGERAIPIPDGYRAYQVVAARIEAALHTCPLPLVPCNNDLVAENVIDDGTLLRLVDYEYSGINDPCFELGNLCNEAEYTPDLVEALCAAYFGKVSNTLLARIRLHACIANMGWTLWACIQRSVSALDFDFWDYALARWERAQAVVEAPDFDRLLAACTSQ